MAVKVKKISKVLIANRGEIACRVINTAKRLGIETVAVHCDAESDGKHVQMAQSAIRLGPPPATTSYLKADAVIAAALRSGAHAVHPCYGFLSENADFAELCSQNGIEFIGPPPGAIRAMGSKSESKRIMIAAGVPVVPGYQGENQDVNLLQSEAGKIGYPVMIKASHGGGGRGMRIVNKEEEFQGQLEAAKREAIKYFANDEVILEKYVPRSRHIEFQVFADKYKNCVYLFERDCSVQRRNQKVLEEAPAPGLSEELRKQMGDVAVRAALAVGYVGAGTVEFLFDNTTQEFYFMEMNTRLQVEHPVTEAIVNFDLVEAQIRVAAGEPLPFGRQEDLKRYGHAIEARIYAEDTTSGFLPGSGTLRYVQLPAGAIEGRPPIERQTGEFVRVDSGFRSGDAILVHYDSMISKLIVRGDTRESALRLLKAALDEYVVVGVPTNIEFLKRCVTHPVFAEATDLSTKFIEENSSALIGDPLPTPLDFTYAMALAVQCEFHKGLPPTVFPSGDPTAAPFRVNAGVSFGVNFLVGEGQSEQAKPVTITHVKGNEWQVTGEGFTRLFELRPRAGDTCTVFCDGVRVDLKGIVTASDITIITPTSQRTIRRRTIPESFGDIEAMAVEGLQRITSPMPGKIIKVNVKAGDIVKKGDVLMVLEAMKMEHSIAAKGPGTVTKVLADVNSMASNKQLLIEIV